MRSAWGPRTSGLVWKGVVGVPGGLELLHQGQQVVGQGQGFGRVRIRPDQHRPVAGGQGVAKAKAPGRLALVAGPGGKGAGLVLARANQQGPIAEGQGWGRQGWG